ncbi:MAG: FAD:protein FMN transferase [Clostridium sp.]|nr:FAD:protein FMN transferase [Clostridium sp.]
MWRYYVRRYKSVILGVFVGIVMVLLLIAGMRTKNVDKNIIDDTFSGKAMGTAVKKTFYSESTADNEAINDRVDACLKELENQISVRIMDSEVAKCNRNYAVGGSYQLSDNIMEYLKLELEIWEETDGAFSPCIRPLTGLWGIEDGDGIVPLPEVIDKVKQSIDASNIELAKNGIIFQKEEMAIDFGAAGKGIACDEIVKELKETDIDGAVVSVGGSIAVYGSKGDSKDWHIGIRDPRKGEEDVMGVLECTGNTMISTSGDYEKYFEQDGKRYHHILDPSTGYPADNGLISVTIISDSGILSDALSTACFVMGLEDGMKYAKKKGVEAIFITKDKQVYLTDGIKKKFNIREDSYVLE